MDFSFASEGNKKTVEPWGSVFSYEKLQVEVVHYVHP